jgi:HAD superfamily hydrolase (TIGR01549 family)
LSDAGIQRPIRGIVFDLDGTLVDSREHILRYNRELFAFVGREFPEAEAQRFFSWPQPALDEFYFSGDEVERAWQFRRLHPYIERLGEIRHMPGSHELLKALGSRPKAILTNRGASTPLLLAQLGWGGEFSPVLTAADTSAPKPSPDGLFTIAAAWNLPAQTLAFVGDSPGDMSCAHAAGALAIGVGPEALQDADVQLPDLFALQTFLGCQHEAAAGI